MQVALFSILTILAANARDMGPELGAREQDTLELIGGARALEEDSPTSTSSKLRISKDNTHAGHAFMLGKHAHNDAHLEAELEEEFVSSVSDAEKKKRNEQTRKKDEMVQDMVLGDVHMDNAPGPKPTVANKPLGVDERGHVQPLPGNNLRAQAKDPKHNVVKFKTAIEESVLDYESKLRSVTGASHGYSLYWSPEFIVQLDVAKSNGENKAALIDYIDKSAEERAAVSRIISNQLGIGVDSPQQIGRAIFNSMSPEQHERYPSWSAEIKSYLDASKLEGSAKKDAFKEYLTKSSEDRLKVSSILKRAIDVAY